MNVHVPSNSGEWNSGVPHFDTVTAAITACTDYLQAFLSFCGAGMNVMRVFASPALHTFLPAVQKEEIQKMWLVWEDLHKVTEQAVLEVRTSTVEAMQEWLIRHQVSDGTDHSNATKSADLAKLMSSCLMTLVQLQYQFSLLSCQSLSDLVNGHVSGSPVPPAAQSTTTNTSSSHPLPIFVRESLMQDASLVNRTHQDEGEEEEEDDDSLESPPLCLLIGRRSSYGGSLHSVSPPPPVSALGRRWSMPGGGDSAIEEVRTREIQQRIGTKESLPEFGRAIKGTGMLIKQKGGMVSREELAGVIDLLSCGSGGQATADKCNSNYKAAPPYHLLDLLTPTFPPTTTACFSLPHVPRKQSGNDRTVARRGPVTTSSYSLFSSPSPTSPRGPGMLQATVGASGDIARGRSGSWNGMTQSSALRASSQPDLTQRLSLPLSRPSFSSALPNLIQSFNKACNKDELGTSGDADGAFSIGLDLVGKDLVASVQQRRTNESEDTDVSTFSENKEGNGMTTVTQVPVTLSESPGATQCNILSSEQSNSLSPGRDAIWTSNNEKLGCGRNKTAFVSFAFEGPAGSTIWTPSSSDCAASRAWNQIGP